MAWHTLKDDRRVNGRVYRFLHPDSERFLQKNRAPHPSALARSASLAVVERDYDPFTSEDLAEVLEVENCGLRDPDIGGSFHGHFEEDKYVPIPQGILS